ncbi:hypothetical protein AX17_005371 [Amanita inopinata Kibby_2008]|nr:hypothetical protein AX17_005371 [Amanita inopinata Kibby_2008]
MGNNFGGSSILEDSILKQLRLSGKIAAFMGDDTWMSVFPDAFHPNMTFPYDSFNVEDLHTVDEGVIAHLFPLLEDPSKPFDFLVGHFLGVDHVGHRVGPDHPSMRAKLEQMNNVLTRVVEDLDNETLLVVLGDHGMDRSGDHGGDGTLETSAALWVYSKGPALTSATTKPPSGLLQYKLFPETVTPHRAIQQIDILPTLSLLLGLPIPYNNLGSIIPEVFWRTGQGDDLRRALEINAEQIKKYLDTYRSSSSGSELDESWDSIMKTWDSTRIRKSGLNTHLVTLNNFNRVALAACRSMWAQFDPLLMGFGLAVLCIGLLSNWFVYAALSRARNDWNNWLKARMPHCFFAAAVGSVVGLAVHWLAYSYLPGIKLLHWVLFFASISSCLVFTITSPPTSSYISLKSFPIVLILHTCAFFSNSFTFWEDRIIPFLLATSVLATFVPTGFTAPTSRLRYRILGFSALFFLSVRLMSVSTVCREEQHPFCHVTFFASSSLPSPPVPVLVLAFPTAAIGIPWTVKRILRITRSDVGIANTFLSVVLRPSLIAGTLFWVTEWADSTHVLGGGAENGRFWASALRSLRSWIARFALGWPLLAGLGLWWLAPLCLQIQVSTVEGNGSDSSSSTTAASSKPKRQVTILGFANAFGAPYLLFWTIFLCVVYASMQLTAQIVLGFATVALLAYLEIVDSVRDVRSLETAFASATPSSILTGSPSSPPSAAVAVAAIAATQLRFSDVVPLALLGLHAFYATGHQATISSIQWKTAFMVTETVRYPWAPFTVTCNLLGPVMLVAGLGAGLVAVWNRAPSVLVNEGDAEGESNGKALERERYDVQVKGDSTLAALGVMIYFGTLLLGTAISAAVLRRHLMVWKVFAPRFMAAAVQLVMVDLGALLGVAVGVGRVANKIGLVFKGVVRG